MNSKLRLVVIGASTGGISVLKTLVAGLPTDFSACILIVQHIGAHPSLLPMLLRPLSLLPVRSATDGEELVEATVLIAPPDMHLLVEGSKARLVRTAKENHTRPAIDPLFRSAATAFKNRAIGVVLTGDLDDGTVGLQAIKAHGGIAIIQDPAEAEARSMPTSAARYVDIDYCLSSFEIPLKLHELTSLPSPTARHPFDERRIEMENCFALTGNSSAAQLDELGARSSMTCPDCGGVLWEMGTIAPTRYRCHTGHAFTAISLLSEQTKLAEEALWAAIRALREKQASLKRLAKSAVQLQMELDAKEYSLAAHATSVHADALKKIITTLVHSDVGSNEFISTESNK